MIGILDYGCGNLKSLINALTFLKLPVTVIQTPKEVDAIDTLILPGVGHFRHAAQCLHNSGCWMSIHEHVQKGRGLLGICVGMQLLLDGSSEARNIPGLGLLPGYCRQFKHPSPNGTRTQDPEARTPPSTFSLPCKVPHMGWNSVAFTHTAPATAYFVHSYYLPGWPLEISVDWQGWCTYGVPFLAAFQVGCIVGCQFHPEKSGTWGLHFLREVLACLSVQTLVN